MDPNDTETVTEVSDVKDLVVDSSTTTDQDAKPAESSPAEGVKGDLLSHVKAALKPEEKSPDSDEQGQKPEDAEADAKKEGEEDADSGGLTEDELKLLPERTAKSFAKMRQSNKKLQGQVTELSTQLDDINPKAEQFDKISRFVSEAGLSKDEVNQCFEVGAYLKNDPLKAFEVLKPIYEQLSRIVGEVLPDDLQQAVNMGQITEVHARELSRTRSTATLATSRLEQTTQRTQQVREQEDRQARVSEVSNKVSEWERSREKSDPDWKLKQSRVRTLVENELLTKQRADASYFPTTDEALAMSKAALESVDKEFKALAPRRKAVSTVTEVGSTRSVAKPTTMLEAAKMGLANAAG